jgi:hypothetical protein
MKPEAQIRSYTAAWDREGNGTRGSHGGRHDEAIGGGQALKLHEHEAPPKGHVLVPTVDGARAYNTW